MAAVLVKPLRRLAQKFTLAIMTQTDVMTAAEAAGRLGVNRMTVQRWAREGRLKKIREAPLLFETAEVEREAAELLEEARAKVAHLASEAAS